jgi:hypothetical protein
MGTAPLNQKWKLHFACSCLSRPDRFRTPLCKFRRFRSPPVCQTRQYLQNTRLKEVVGRNSRRNPHTRQRGSNITRTQQSTPWFNSRQRNAVKLHSGIFIFALL